MLRISNNVSIDDNEILTNSIDASEIEDDTLLEADLDMVDTAADEAILTFESGAGGDFEWHTGAELCVGITGDPSLCDSSDAVNDADADQT